MKQLIKEWSIDGSVWDFVHWDDLDAHGAIGLSK